MDGMSQGNPGSPLKLVRTIVSTVTGHRTEDLELDMSLEQDLGLDSIKLVEVVSHLLGSLPPEIRDRLRGEASLKSVLRTQTLGELITLFETWIPMQASSATAPQKAAPARVVPSSEGRGAVQIPILDAQYPFLVAHWAISTCSLVSRVRLQGYLDQEVLRLAFSDVLGKHPALRSRFEIPHGTSSFSQYRLLIELPSATLDFVDLEALPSEEQESVLGARVEQLLGYRWNLEAAPLCRMTVVRLGHDRHELMFTNHHLVSDGKSNQTVIRDILTRYRERCSGGLPDAAVSPADLGEVVASLNSWQNDQEERALDSMLREQGNRSFFFNPRRRELRGTEASARVRRHRLDAEATSRLQECARSLRVSLNTLLVGTYVNAVAALDPSLGEVTVNVPTAGRVYPRTDVGEVVGCFAQNLAMTFAVRAEGQAWSSYLGQVQAQIEGALASGCDRAQTRRAARAAQTALRLEDGRVDAISANLVRAGVRSNLYLSFVGRVGLDRRYGPVAVEDYEAATTTNAGAIDNLVEIAFGCLQVTCNYDGDFFDMSTIDSLLRRFIGDLSAASFGLGQEPSVGARNAKGVEPRYEGTASRGTARLLAAASKILGRPLSPADLNKDLEADFGFDSLERVRLLVALGAGERAFDRRRALASRTLVDVASALETSSSVAEVSQDFEVPWLSFVTMASSTPNAIAIDAGDSRLTYAELHAASSRLANALLAEGVDRGQLVAILCEPGPSMLVGMLAALKAGAAYVPLDPGYPPARLEYILQHSRARVLVTEPRTLSGPLSGICRSSSVTHVFLVDDASSRTDDASFDLPGRMIVPAKQWQMSSSAMPKVRVSSEDRMLVLYTSGSTGKPKGVVLNHRGYMNRLRWMQKLFPISAGDRIAQKTSCCFDISVWELYWPLLHGATVCPVARATVRDPWALAEWIERARINVIHFVPSLFSEFVRAIASERFQFPDLRWVIFSGEALSVVSIQQWMDRYGTRVGLANLYGPTEASIDVTAEIIQQRPEGPRISIGKAMANCHVLVLDEKLNRCRQGELGELYLGGVQLAMEYLNNPDANQAAFVRNPFSTVPGKVLYRTGDLAVELEDGRFDYRGRRDAQVKIRGFRVELGEVEAVLNQFPGVVESAVLVTGSGELAVRLVAHVGGALGDGARGELREHLRRQLPEYMVPHEMEFWPSLPKNANGKLDRGALRPSPPESASMPKVVTAPESAPSKVVTDPRGALPPLAATGTGAVRKLPLGPGQTWLLTYFKPPYRWCGFTRFEYRQPLDVPLFNEALTKLVERHEALRTYFQREGSEWVQCVAPAARVEAIYEDQSSLPESDRQASIELAISETIASLRIDTLPLFRVHAFRLTEDRYTIVVVGHHLVSDMLSNGILFEDIWRIYGGLLVGEDALMAPAKQYGELACLLEKLHGSSELGSHVRYYEQQFPSREYAFSVPIDARCGGNDEASSAFEHWQMDGFSARLSKARSGFGCSTYAILASALYRVLGDWAKQEWVVVSHRSHGRDLGDGHAFFQSVGNFAVNYPLGLRVEKNDTAEALLDRTAQALEAVPMGGVTYDTVGRQLPVGMYPDNLLTPVRLNFLGNRTLPEGDLFRFDAEDRDQRYAPPEEPRTSLLEFFLETRGEDLCVAVSYSKNFHLSESIRSVGNRFVAAVELLVQEGMQKAALRERATRAKRESVGGNGSRRRDSSATVWAKGFLEGKVAVVSGAGRGIGRATASRLAALGAHVVVVSRNADHVARTVEEIRATQGAALGVTADVSRPNEVENVVQRAIDGYGSIDMLVNNAGITAMASVAESNPREWREIIEVNLMGAYYFCRLVVPHMIKHGSGKIINVGSDSSEIGYPLFSAYAASKHGLLGLTKSLAEELKQKRIQVNAVCPALVDTDMAPRAFRKQALAVDDVANVIAFLASPLSDSITGEALRVYGTQDLYWFGSKQLDVVGLSHSAGA